MSLAIIIILSAYAVAMTTLAWQALDHAKACMTGWNRALAGWRRAIEAWEETDNDCEIALNGWTEALELLRTHSSAEEAR